MRRLNGLILFTISICIAFGLYGFLHINIEENLNETLPNAAENAVLKSWIDNQKRKTVFTVAINSSQTTNEIHTLGRKLVDQLDSSLQVKKLSFANDMDPNTFVEHIYENLPIYLDDQDYIQIDSLINEKSIEHSLIQNKKKLTSPEGIGSKNYYFLILFT